MEDRDKFRVGEGKMALEGFSGKPCIFEITQVLPMKPISEMNFNKTAGVYVLLADNPDTLPIIDLFVMGITNQKINDLPFRYVYIGETNDLSVEFKNHPKITCLESFRIFLILWFPLDNKNERIKIVKDILPTKKFICN